MLTKKQLDLLEFIHKRVQRDGVPPSFDEMKEALDLRSKSGIHRLITALEERGFIRRLAHRARAIEIVKLPDALAKPRLRAPRDRRRPARSRPCRGAMAVAAVAGGGAVRGAADGPDCRRSCRSRRSEIYANNIAVPAQMLSRLRQPLTRWRCRATR